MTAPSLQIYAWAAPIFMITLGILSVVDLALGVVQAVRLSREPIEPVFTRFYLHGPSSAQIVFYAITLPLASVVFTSIDAAFFACVKDFRRVITSLVGAVLLLVGWIIQMAFWTNCEQISRDDSGLQDFCPQAGMLAVTSNESGLDSVPQTAKYAFGWIITVGYFAYMTFVAVVISKAKKAEKTAMGKLDNIEPARLHSG